VDRVWNLVATYSEHEHDVVPDVTGGELSFFGLFATFDTPFEVTTSELAIEFLFPADRRTAEALGARGRDRS
jgi:hypothetical protein